MASPTSPPEPITVLLADHQRAFRHTLARTLERCGWVAMVAQARTFQETLESVRQTPPDVVLLAAQLPGGDPFHLARNLRESHPQTRIVIVGDRFRDCHVQRALAADAAGYLVKGGKPDAMLEAIRTVAAGQYFFSPEIWNRIVIDDRGPRLLPRPQARLAALTPREREVLRLLGSGLSKQEIASQLSIRVQSVDRHLNQITAKLGVHDRVELARLALRAIRTNRTHRANGANGNGSAGE